LSVILMRRKIGNVYRHFAFHHVAHSPRGSKRCTRARIDEGTRCVERGKKVKKLAIPAIDIAKLGVANAYSILQHSCEHRLKITGRATDNPQHLRGGRLLFKRFGQLARALLFGLEQPRVLNRDHCLIGEGFDQLDLLVRERTYSAALQDEHTNRDPLSQKRHAQECAKVADSCEFTELEFRISKNVRNLNGYAL